MDATQGTAEMTHSWTRPTPILITPVRAAEMLQRGQRFNPRGLRKATVRYYVLLMQRGQWRLSPDAIVLGPDGEIWNGQHRLAAVVESGIAQPFYLLTESDPDVVRIIDCGLTRRPAELCRLDRSAQYMALLRGFYEFPAFPNKYYWPPDQLLEAEAKASVHVTFARSLLAVKTRISPVALLAAIARCHACGGEEAALLFAQTIRGETPQYPGWVAAQRLRENLLVGSMRSSADRGILYRKAQHVLMAIVNGRELVLPKAVEDDLFPIPPALRIRLVTRSGGEIQPNIPSVP